MIHLSPAGMNQYRPHYEDAPSLAEVEREVYRLWELQMEVAAFYADKALKPMRAWMFGPRATA